MTVHVVLSTGSSSEFTNGEKEFDIEARNVRGVIKVLDAKFPGFGEFLEAETMVAIDGELFEDGLYQPLRDGCELFFLPKLEAG
jgi:sulfur-carrier protein